MKIENPDARLGDIELAFVVHAAGHFALFAAGALTCVDDQSLEHTLLPELASLAEPIDIAFKDKLVLQLNYCLSQKARDVTSQTRH